jgi:hypothetical protein
MSQGSERKEAIQRHFVEIGEAEVRRRLQPGVDGSWGGEYAPFAAQWIGLREEARSEAEASERRAARAQETALASRAAKAAERSATAAEDATSSARKANALAAAANDLAEAANRTAEEAAASVAAQARAARTYNGIAIASAVIAAIALVLSIWNMAHTGNGGFDGGKAQAQTKAH